MTYDPAEARKLHLIHCAGCSDCARWRANVPIPLTAYTLPVDVFEWLERRLADPPRDLPKLRRFLRDEH